MSVLSVQLIKNNTTIDAAELPFENRQERQEYSGSFFLALVKICDKLKVEIPIWTYAETKQMEKNNEVVIKIDDNLKLKIVIRNNDGIPAHKCS